MIERHRLRDLDVDPLPDCVANLGAPGGGGIAVDGRRRASRRRGRQMLGRRDGDPARGRPREPQRAVDRRVGRAERHPCGAGDPEVPCTGDGERTHQRRFLLRGVRRCEDSAQASHLVDEGMRRRTCGR